MRCSGLSSFDPEAGKRATYRKALIYPPVDSVSCRGFSGVRRVRVPAFYTMVGRKISQRGCSRFCRVLLVPYPKKGHNGWCSDRWDKLSQRRGRLPWTMMSDAPASMLKCEPASAPRSSRRASHHHPCRVTAAFAKAGLTDRLARFRRAWTIVLPANA